MSKRPVAVRRSPMAKHTQELDQHRVSVEQPTSLFSFRYSSIEISAVGSAARVKRREARFENGTLKAEEFEGTIDRNTYDNSLRDFHERLLQQMSLLTKSMLWFLPQRRDSQER